LASLTVLSKYFLAKVFKNGERKFLIPNYLCNFPFLTLCYREYAEAQSRQFSSGCQDNFAIFAFLAFLLTVLDLVLEMQGGAGRKKREEDPTLSSSSMLNNEVGRNATLVTYSLFRGFLNSVDANHHHCKMKYICEGAEESLKYGYIAPKMINLSRQKLRKLDNHHHFALALTSAKIMSDKTCSEKYPSCATSMAKPDSYRNVALDHANVEEMRVTEALEAFNKVRHQWSGLRTH